ncbi:Pentatricopeptide repeat [Dillenia turbinata]|uniref:Pentatricopeptide repeat n=1 Tax=Dillenia turbinata TaxID=194707 RepID=A0AAN8YTX3_9MAGN
MAAAGRAATTTTRPHPKSSLVCSITSTLQTLNLQNPNSYHPLDSFIPHLNPNLVIQVINSQENPYLSLFFFNWSSNPNPNPNNYSHAPLCYSAITDHLLSHNLFSAASSLLESHNQLSDFLIAKFIKSYGTLGDVKLAIHWFRRAKLIESGDCLYSYNSVLVALVKNNRIKLARAFYDEIIRENVVKPDVLTCTIMIRGYCKLGLIKDAKKVFDEMPCEPNLVTFNTMIHGFCKRGLIENALEIVERMKEDEEWLPDTVTYTTLIDGYCRRGELKEAMKLMDEMVKKGCEPNEVTYNALINGLCLSGDVDEGKVKLAEMMLKGLKGNRSTHASLLKGLSVAGRSDEAIQHLRYMVSSGMKLDPKSYAVVVNEYCKMGKPKEAIPLLKEMRMRGISPRVCIYNAVLRKLVDSSDLDGAVHFLKQMQEMGWFPNFISYSTVICGICRAKGRMQEVEELVMNMRRDGHDLDPSMYSCLIKGYCKDGKVQKAVHLFLESVSAGYMISIETFVVLFNELCASWKLSEVDEVFEEMTRRCPGFDVGLASYVEKYKSLWTNWEQKEAT